MKLVFRPADFLRAVEGTLQQQQQQVFVSQSAPLNGAAAEVFAVVRQQRGCFD